jgi:protein-disulfide isomerase
MTQARKPPTPARRPTSVRKPARSSSGRFYALLGILGIAGIATIAWMANRPKPAARAAVVPGAAAAKAEPWVLGSPTAPVTIMEFADFECPACSGYATVTGPDVKTRLIETGQARLEFYPFPLDIHPNTWDASLAAACAGDQGKFWEMHDRLFAGQYDWNAQATSNPRKVIRPYAQALQLDLGKYDQCMESEVHRPRIQASYNFAVASSVGNTPSFIIGGKLYPGSLPYDEIKRLVDEAAKTAPAAGTATATATGAAAGTATAAAR